MNKQHSLIQELYTSEATKNICGATVEGTVDHSRVSRRFKKFRLDYKKLDDQKRSGREKKSMNSEGILQAIEAYMDSIRQAYHLSPVKLITYTLTFFFFFNKL